VSETLIERIRRHAKDNPDVAIEIYPGDVLELIDNAKAERARLAAALAEYADKNNWTSETTVYYENPNGSEGQYDIDLGERCIWKGEYEEGYAQAEEDLTPASRAAGELYRALWTVYEAANSTDVAPSETLEAAIDAVEAARKELGK